jgi:ATP-dependent helicase HrpB
LAVLLSERDPLAGRDAGCDLEARLSVIGQHRTLRERSRQLRRQLDRLGVTAPEKINSANAAELVLRAFPQWLGPRASWPTGSLPLTPGTRSNPAAPRPTAGKSCPRCRSRGYRRS